MNKKKVAGIVAVVIAVLGLMFGADMVKVVKDTVGTAPVQSDVLFG